MQSDNIYPMLIVLCTIFVFFTTTTATAQPADPDDLLPQQPASVPVPSGKPGTYATTRGMERTGTAINGARNSVSIKSTDAGIIHYPPVIPAPPHGQPVPGATYDPSASNCAQCGVIDSIRPIDPNTFNAITSGIVAGTIAQKIRKHGSHSHLGPESHPHPSHRGHRQHHEVGVIMNDGSHQIFNLPDASNLHHGDSIQLIDGVIVPNHH